MDTYFDLDAFRARVSSSTAEAHATVYGVVYSPCGEYMAAVDSRGVVRVWALSPALQGEWWAEGEDGSPGVPLVTATLHRGPIYGVELAEIGSKVVLATGASDGLGLWDWAALLASGGEATAVAAAQLLALDAGDVAGTPVEVNAVALDPASGLVVCGTGAGEVRAWDVATGSHSYTLTGHTDMVLDVGLRGSGSAPVSASEDGTVKLWDAKAGGCSASLQPGGGAWVGALALDPDASWLATGGGDCAVSLWHLASLTQTTTMETKACVQTVVFADEHVLAGGASPWLYRFNINGRLAAKLPVTRGTG
ncbi:WD40-repeat protein [Thecamonas trahens ATCC 50062]|uniref:WD40-repeat protein n=1 Tax=Thecamonas trahens ATCC 50062 TaxID=461836 RepID=A0A0L0D1F4_THETB|nr:WD40-repeat protein [Thecamonas trahens ATCC 50062]KNC45965.1 WD40-repeat protein [Thecamonas trahens ATCC 50062]|eukprot:XP_013762946.1 WD40-repeat protein [Thecamonas trahens ATCC 50062]